MENFAYAHRNNALPERKTHTAQFNTPQISQELQNLRMQAFAREIPVSNDETLCYLLTQALACKPKRILEIGTAVGLSGVALLQALPQAQLTTIEREQAFYDEAAQNFASFGVIERVTQIFGDAGEQLCRLQGQYDFIFLDSAKVQYVKYIPHLLRLLAVGGTLFADDVLLYGYVTGEVETPKKRQALVGHIREYLQAVTTHPCLSTTVLNVGDGVALSVKIKDNQ